LSEEPTAPKLAPGATGRGVRVALLDTGVNFEHPHIRRSGLQVGVVRGPSGLFVEQPDLHGDRVGHGTACAALLFHLAPEVELISVRVTDARPSTDAERLAFAILSAAELGAEIIAVPLGTPNPNHDLEAAVRSVVAQGCVVVAARPGPVVYPAILPGVLGVAHRDGVDLLYEAGEWWAEGRARPVPGSPSRNFHGPSLAVARLSAGLARYRQECGAFAPNLVVGFQKALAVL
jgi:hypothetical protein